MGAMQMITGGGDEGDAAPAAAMAGGEGDALVAAATAGDEAAFGEIVERHRREIQVHCYRMLGSFEESEDLVQETFLRAWRGRESFAGRAPFRAWLYRIATNACLDAIEKRRRRIAPVEDPRPVNDPRPAADPREDPPETGPGEAPEPSGSFEVLWLQPYPDHLLEGVADPGAGPADAVIDKETIELAFIVAIQKLPARQRAVLILRGVLDWSARDAAELLEISVPAVNSALQRARSTLRSHLPERRAEWAPGQDPTAAERALLERYIEANDNADFEAFAELMREDALFAMPPLPETWQGAQRIIAAWRAGGFGTPELGELRSIPTRVNRQPAVACYRRRAGDEEFRPLAIDVLRIEEGLIAEIVTFPGALFEALGLPASLG